MPKFRSIDWFALRIIFTFHCYSETFYFDAQLESVMRDEIVMCVFMEYNRYNHIYFMLLYVRSVIFINVYHIRRN